MQHKSAGNRIKELRKGKAWTQEHLAAAAQISARTVQRGEEGVMSGETAMAIAGALDVPLEDILRPEPACPTFVPIIFYKSATTLDWLVKAFGFAVEEKMLGPDSAVLHAELSFRGGLIMVGAPVADRKWKTPLELDRAATQSVMVAVDDVDDHYERAAKAGAVILVKPEDSYGQRRYRVEDPEGHVWTFSQPLTG